MSPLVLLALASNAHAESIIEFKTTGPVQISVDGQQATMQGNMRQRISGLAPGVHNLEVAGVFGKKLFEAEIELPDNTVTYAEWARGEIRVLKTEWLEADAPAEEIAATEPEADTGADLLGLPGAIPVGGVVPEAAAGVAGAPVGEAPGTPAADGAAPEAAPADVASGGAEAGGASGAGGGAGGVGGGAGGGGIGLGGIGGIGVPGAGLAGGALGAAGGAAGGVASGAGSVAGAGAGAGAAMQAAGPMAAAGAAGGAAPGVGAGIGAAIGAGVAVAAGGVGAAVAGQDGGAPPPIEEVAIGSEGDPDAFPVPGMMAVDSATALPSPRPSTLTLEAYDGMRLEVVNNGKTLIVVVEGDSFRIQDGSGLNLALSGE